MITEQCQQILDGDLTHDDKAFKFVNEKAFEINFLVYRTKVPEVEVRLKLFDKVLQT